MPRSTTKNIKFLTRLFTQTTKSLKQRINKDPFRAALFSFLALIILIILSKTVLSRTQPEPIATAVPLKVQALHLADQSLTQTISATVTDKSILTLVAGTAGPVKTIHHQEGDTLQPGSVILSLETTYNAGDSASVNSQIAAKNLELAKDTLTNTAATVSKQRELAQANRDNQAKLTDINRQSLDSIHSQTDLNQDLIDSLESTIASTTDASTKQSLEQQLLSLKSSLTQTQTNLKNLEFSTDDDQAPIKIDDINKDLIFLTTDLQLKSAQNSLYLAKLNLQAARIQAALSHPSSPIPGTLERLFVSPGQHVTPGTPVALIRGKQGQLEITATLSATTATLVDLDRPITTTVESTKVQLPDYHLSSVPTQNNLHQLTIAVPRETGRHFHQGQTLTLNLPLLTSTANQDLLIPIDSVFITNQGTFVYTQSHGFAIKRVVEIGPITGEFVTVTSGLTLQDTLLLDRRLLENQPIETAI